MIHHPIAQPTQFSSGTCAVAREQSDLPDHAPNLRHMCETFGGSSGALILDADERVVVGLHQGTDVKPDARGRLDGFNIGFKFDPVNLALGLAFEPLNVVEGRLDGVLALRGLDRKRTVLEDVASRYPGTKVAARAAGMLQALPERDIDSEALAALEAVGKIADPARRKAALDQVGRDFDGTQAARQAKRLLALMQPKQKTRDEHATDWLVLALQITDDAWQRALLEAIVSEFDGTAAAGSAAAMLAKMAVANRVPKQVVEPNPSIGPIVAMTVKQDGSGDFRTIADAVKAAEPGARIEIYPGTYQGGVDVDKALDLVGIGDRDKIIWEAKDDAVIHWTAGSGRIANLSLRQLGGKFHSVNFDGGSALLEDCDLTSLGWAIVAIHKRADPVLRGNVIHNGKQGGVLVFNKGRGLLEKNEIYGNGLAGVSIKTDADPVLRGNVIRDGKQGGAMIYERGRGLLENNEIFGNAFSNVEIRIAADPVLRGNVIRGGKYSGVFIHDKGRGLLEENEIYGNAQNGVSIGSEADPELRGNVISGNTYHAIEIYDGGKGTIVGNDLRGNVRGAFDVEITAGDVIRRDNQE
ncbi:right-handed parallel beta-helix repeat-containing protein [Antarctobacter heliothermus]|nr:right-handed parallel beta-helix repeat-containing protein [Antarctobacter heliothermus]